MTDLINRIKELQQKNIKILIDPREVFLFPRNLFRLKEVLPIIQHHKYGFMDKKGNIVIQPIYDDFKGEFSRIKTSICVKKKNKWGIITLDGQTIADFEYDFIFPSIVNYANYQKVCPYYNQLYTVCRKHQWGILKNDGSIFVEFGKYDWIDGYDSGLARVKKKDKWGMIDFMGQIVIPLKYDNIWNFYDKGRIDTIIEQGDVQHTVLFKDLLSKYNIEFINNEFDMIDFEIAEINKSLTARSVQSINENTYNENLDFDQQDPEFWDSF